MNSLNQAFYQQRSMRISAAVVLYLAMLFASYPDTSSAQGTAASNVLKLLGKFAMGVATGVTASIVADEAKGMIHQVSGYKFTLMWQSRDGNYSGTLVMRGVKGTFRVRTPINIIDQDMGTQSYEGDILLVGSNPRYAGSLASVPDYSPDTFRLTQLQSGEWIIADTCNTQGMCAPVHVVEAGTF